MLEKQKCLKKNTLLLEKQKYLEKQLHIGEIEIFKKNN